MSGDVFSAKTLRNNESKFHILQIRRLKLFTQITLSIVAFALHDIDMSMLLLFLIQENIFFPIESYLFDCGRLRMRMFRIILTILSPFLSIFQPTIERNNHHCQLCYQIYFSVIILKVTLLTLTALTFLNKKLLTETTGRGLIHNQS